MADTGTPPPGLPELERPPCSKEMRGPTPWCNWVIKGHLLAGGYPASIDDQDTDAILTTLLSQGICTFVCLQSEVSLQVSEAKWRCGHALRPYIHDAQRILSWAHQSGNSKITQPKIDFLHLPIVDGSITSDEAIMRLRDDCCNRLLRGEKMYVHCWGGHGRTGTLICLILGKLYGIRAPSALALCQAYHDSRRYPQGVRSPQTPVQRVQVQRIMGMVESKKAGGNPAAVARGISRNAEIRSSSRTSSQSNGSKTASRVSRAVRGSLDNSSVIDSMNSLSLSGSSAAQNRQVPLSQRQSYSKGPSGRHALEKKAEEATQKRRTTSRPVFA